MKERGDERTIATASRARQKSEAESGFACLKCEHYRVWADFFQWLETWGFPLAFSSRHRAISHIGDEPQHSVLACQQPFAVPKLWLDGAQQCVAVAPLRRTFRAVSVARPCSPQLRFSVEAAWAQRNGRGASQV